MVSQAAQSIRKSLVKDSLDNTSIELKRALWEESTQRQPTPSGVSVRHLLVGGVDCLLCVPDQLDTDRTIVYCHGGGLVEGSVETHRIWTCRLAQHTGAQVLSINYRLAPEHPHPAAINDVLSVCQSVQSDDHFAGGFCIGADSTGCIPALLALVNLQSDSVKDPSCGFLLSPSIDLTFSGASIGVNARHDPFVSLQVLKHYAQLYADNNDLNDPCISPLFADLQNLPPMLVMVDGHEILLDDSRRLVEKIERAGGKANLHVSQALWHVWPLWDEFPESLAALDNIRAHVLAAKQGPE